MVTDCIWGKGKAAHNEGIHGVEDKATNSSFSVLDGNDCPATCLFAG